ncbi:MAG: hypothetical protein BLITH_0552 [Brockia lithotrophica]|uniref:Iron-only hydrogenase system regulator n=1 Tax=Brockia lithotrophica TaxID=933949 RepID=A0A2T5G4K3_9BACL|nr:hypothetical protein [Brockia lithotrophica]MBT9253297.1 hypothetical protein [Brockia lithotrophica]PTQ51122.1 MAG: hypothetical protein BLITH_0552 [Brockia lithotrophica]
MKTHFGTASVHVHYDRVSLAAVNEILARKAHLILGRVELADAGGDVAISLIVRGTDNELGTLVAELEALPNVKASLFLPKWEDE